MNRSACQLTVVTPPESGGQAWERNWSHMATPHSAEATNDLIDLTNNRVDNLAALITVTAEQMDDRNRAGMALDAGEHRSAELIELVFGSDTPSVESYLAARRGELQAA